MFIAIIKGSVLAALGREKKLLFFFYRPAHLSFCFNKKEKKEKTLQSDVMTAEEPELLNCNRLAGNQECKLAQ